MFLLSYVTDPYKRIKATHFLVVFILAVNIIFFVNNDISFLIQIILIIAVIIHHNDDNKLKMKLEDTMLVEHELLNKSKIAQEKLNKSIDTLSKNLISSSGDLNGIITFASEALCEISGYTQDELLNKPHSILRHKDTPSAIFKVMWENLKSGKQWSGELKNRKKDGGYYWVSTTIVPEFDLDENITGYTSVRHDITPQKAKEEFMANMSHELRTPLNSIMGFSSILNKKLKTKENIELGKQINHSSKSLLKLVNDILDLSKIEDSKFTIDPFEFQAYDEAVKLFEQFEGLTTKNTLEFNNTIGTNLHGTFMGDWTRIDQVILNLVSNSIKFTPETGIINVNVDYKHGSLIIIIEDNGIGMSKDVQDKIFKPFEQADGSTTRKYGGTGLGLSITQNLVELMHGKIELESKEGVGTTFNITIPLEKLSDEESKKIDVDIVDKISLDTHVLVAEDNKTNQLLIKMLLDEFGVTCDVANDGVEAVDMYNPDIHSLILMDENMPNMNGLEAMRLIKEKYTDKCGAIIALTANAMQGDKERFLKHGMDAFVTKPIDEDELYRTIKELRK